jgi:hypothetical protein
VWLAAEWVRLGRADHLLGARMRDRCSSLSGPVSVRSDRGSLGPIPDSCIAAKFSHVAPVPSRQTSPTLTPRKPLLPYIPRFRALAPFGRRLSERVDSLAMPASENLHRS